MSDDDGFVTVAVVGLAMALALVASLVVALAAVGVARHQAAAAADLAALYGAQHALEGEVVACAAAARVARAQGARLTSCEVTGLDVRLVAVVRPGGRLGALGEARAAAVAGPGTNRGLGPS